MKIKKIRDVSVSQVLETKSNLSESNLETIRTIEVARFFIYGCRGETQVSAPKQINVQRRC